MASKGQKPAKVAKLTPAASAAADNEFQQDKLVEEALNSLKSVQEKLEQIEEQFSKDFMALEAKANQKRKPLYDDRRKILQKIPFFWATCLFNTPFISQLMADSDVDVLRELIDLHVEVAADVKSGFKITFTFNKNAFFEPETIVKQYSFSEGSEMPQVTTTKINWKKDPRKKAKPTSGGPKSSSKKRPIDDTDSTSFFDFLESNDPIYVEVADSIKEIFSDPISLYLQNEGDDSDAEEDDDESDDESNTKKLLEKIDDGDDDDDDDGDFNEGAIAAEESSEDDDDEGVADE